MGGGEGQGGQRVDPWARDELAVDDLEVHGGLGACEREQQLAHGERLFPKPRMSGHVKPPLGRLHAPQPRDGGGPRTYE